VTIDVTTWLIVKWQAFTVLLAWVPSFRMAHYALEAASHADDFLLCFERITFEVILAIFKVTGFSVYYSATPGSSRTRSRSRRIRQGGVWSQGIGMSERFLSSHCFCCLFPKNRGGLGSQHLLIAVLFEDTFVQDIFEDIFENFLGLQMHCQTSVSKAGVTLGGGR